MDCEKGERKGGGNRKKQRVGIRGQEKGNWWDKCSYELL